MMTPDSGVRLELGLTRDEAANHGRFCVHCGQSWDNGLGACGCQDLRTFRRYVNLAAELVRQHRLHCGPKEGDPFDADLWIAEATALLQQIAGGRP